MYDVRQWAVTDPVTACVARVGNCTTGTWAFWQKMNNVRNVIIGTELEDSNDERLRFIVEHFEDEDKPG